MPSSFNKNTETLLDEDVYKNLKDFQKKKYVFFVLRLSLGLVSFL